MIFNKLLNRSEMSEPVYTDKLKEIKQEITRITSSRIIELRELDNNPFAFGLEITSLNDPQRIEEEVLRVISTFYPNFKVLSIHTDNWPIKPQIEIEGVSGDTNIFLQHFF